MKAILLLAALGLVVADSEEVVRCQNEESNCIYNITLKSGKHLYCVHNQPLLSSQLFTGGLLRLFDVQKLRVTGSSTVTVRTASEDTWLADLVRFDELSTEERASRALDEDQPLSAWFGDTIDSLLASGADKLFKLSPFGTSCVALKSNSNFFSDEVKVEWRRDGPLKKDAELRLWMGPALMLAGLLLYAYAELLAESAFFHYASWTSGFMIFSIFVLLWFISSRTGRTGRYLTTAAGLSGLVGAWAWDMFKVELAHHWPCALPTRMPHPVLARPRAS